MVPTLVVTVVVGSVVVLSVSKLPVLVAAFSKVVPLVALLVTVGPLFVSSYGSKTLSRLSAEQDSMAVYYTGSNFCLHGLKELYGVWGVITKHHLLYA